MADDSGWNIEMAWLGNFWKIKWIYTIENYLNGFYYIPHIQ